MPRSILRIWLWFFDAVFFLDAVFIMHQPTNGKPAPFLCIFCWTNMTDTRIRKNTKATITCLKKRRSSGAGFPFVCTFGSNTRLKFQIETRKIKRGIAVMPLVLITACSMYRNRFCVISLDAWRTGQCNRYRSSPCVFRTVYTNFTLIGNNDFLKLLHKFYVKNVAKNRWFWVSSDISTRSSRIRKLFRPAYAPLTVPR